MIVFIINPTTSHGRHHLRDSFRHSSRGLLRYCDCRQISLLGDLPQVVLALSLRLVVVLNLIYFGIDTKCAIRLIFVVY